MPNQRLAGIMKLPSTPLRHVTQPASEEKAFRFRSGQRAASLVAFGRALAEASAEDVWYHRLHFVPWLREVVGDEPLAARVEMYAKGSADADVLREILRDLVAARVSELARLVPSAP